MSKVTRSSLVNKALGFLTGAKSSYATEVKFDTKPYRLHKLDQAPASAATLTKDDAIQYYTQMHTIRRMETSAGNLYKEKIIRGFCHLYSGQVSTCNRWYLFHH
ncbi:pyruvate dehydrogenase E1 component subunit alpha type II, mitochondrial-like isoform X2 [Photinus pyralis]|uniref:pyruvate dehydrogenase E1 component subunit alpha type II, mitochondrial-like isoform X2 n=1 Tax=Photinus pyralis TaxID=7054 RepID=UPI001267727B|nr:pyruvate dehydrogenase E1 component subunit alpha type II, mitochondrial-like isoform X2 [Photinus pyralis]